MFQSASTGTRGSVLRAAKNDGSRAMPTPLATARKRRSWLLTVRCGLSSTACERPARANDQVTVWPLLPTDTIACDRTASGESGNV
jgi:hypothetical protein